MDQFYAALWTYFAPPLTQDVVYARLVAQKGDQTVPELVEELIKDNLAKLEAEAEAVRGPKKPKAARVATKG